jgi:hypothetical protein
MLAHVRRSSLRGRSSGVHVPGFADHCSMALAGGRQEKMLSPGALVDSTTRPIDRSQRQTLSRLMSASLACVQTDQNLQDDSNSAQTGEPPLSTPLAAAYTIDQ